MKNLILFFLTLMLLTINPLFSQWGPQGVIVCDTSTNTNSMLPEIAPDDEGGAYIAWTDVRNGHYDIYAQRLDSAGIPQWQYNGIPIARNNTSQRYQKIISDGKGGAYIAWEDNRGDNTYIWAQRINKAGGIYWQENGVKIAETGGLFIALSLDKDFNLLVSWIDFIEVGEAAAIVQRIDSLGNRLWPDSGIQVTTRPGTIYSGSISITSDGASGGMVTWSEGTDNDSMRVYVQRIDSAGAIQWIENGICMSDTALTAVSPAVRSDQKGGAFISWYYPIEDFNAPGGIQRISHNGDIYWEEFGLFIPGTGAGGSGIERLTNDNNYGVFFGESFKIYHIDSSGSQLWPDGVSFGTGGGTNSSQVYDGFGGIYNFWQSWEDGAGYNIKVQWIDSIGTAHHGENGVNVIEPLEIHFQQWPKACSDGRNGAIVCFRNPSPESYHIIYANHVDTSFNPVGIQDNSFIPNKIELKQNYLNPFNPETVISYQLPVNSEVNLSIYNVMGQKIKTLFTGNRSAGYYQITWKGKDEAGNSVGTGIYFYRLTVNSAEKGKNYIQSKKMLLIK